MPRRGSKSLYEIKSKIVVDNKSNPGYYVFTVEGDRIKKRGTEMKNLTDYQLKQMDIDDLRDVAGDDELYNADTRRRAQTLVDEFDA
jgi:hypothetical protein